MKCFFVIVLLLLLCLGDSYRICHFNDVYESDSSSMLCEFKYELDKLNCSVKTFGGDAFFYSDNSIKSNGTVMPLVLSELGVTVAVPGNHEFDMGVEFACALFNTSRFPWILSNVPSLSGCLQHIYEDDTAVYVGLWYSNLQSVLPSSVDVIDDDFSLGQTSKMVVALTHMDLDDDISLGDSGWVDLILGGHDHDVVSPVFGLSGVPIVKSLSEYREIQVVDVDIDRNFQFSKVSVSKSKSMDDCAIQRFVASHMSRFSRKTTCVPFEIDTRYVRYTSSVDSVRRLLGEFLGKFLDADMIMLNAGVFRGNRVFHRGEDTMSFVMNVPLVELECSRDVVWLMLYYGLLTCDDNRCGYRAHVLTRSNHEVKVSWLSRLLEFNNDKDRYKVVVTEFQSEGKDGYDLLLECNTTHSQRMYTHDLIYI